MRVKVEFEGEVIKTAPQWYHTETGQEFCALFCQVGDQYGAVTWVRREHCTPINYETDPMLAFLRDVQEEQAKWAR